MYDAGSSNPVRCDDLEQWDAVVGGREVQEGGDMCIPIDDHVDGQQKLTQ